MWLAQKNESQCKIIYRYYSDAHLTIFYLSYRKNNNLCLGTMHKVKMCLVLFYCDVLFILFGLLQRFMGSFVSWVMFFLCFYVGAWNVACRCFTAIILLIELVSIVLLLCVLLGNYFMTQMCTRKKVALTLKKG